MMKKWMVWILMAVFACSISTQAFAAVSPESEPVTEEVPKRDPKAPKTGEGNAVIYAGTFVLLFTGTAVVARKKLQLYQTKS